MRPFWAIAWLAVLLVGVATDGFSQAPTLQPKWDQLSPASSPSARDTQALAYDAAHSQVVLFGGYNGNFLNDTWLWNGTTWSQASPANSPSPRSNEAMVYDPATGNVVLFGGLTSVDTRVGDTWIWDGTNWTQLSPANSPSPRASASMVYDAATGNVVLFGGLDTNGSALNDTWIWDGTNWSQAGPKSAPAQRFSYAMAYDAAHGQVMLFGGVGPDFVNGGQQEFSDTWTWDGSNWIQQSPGLAPAARDDAGVAYDPALGQVVLFGGEVNALTGTSINDTWIWNGSTWTEESLAVSPAARIAGNSLVYDAAENELVLFGGVNFGGSSGLYSDTWSFGLPQNFGNVNVCPSGQSVPAPCSNQLALTFNVSTAITLGSPSVVTQGAAGLDFSLAGGGTCEGFSGPGTCTVVASFAPQAPGLRLGAVELHDTATNLLLSTPVYGIGQAPEISVGPGAQTTVGNGLTNPYSIAADAAGNVFIADWGDGRVVKIAPGGAQTDLVSGLGVLEGVAVDGAGNVYTAEQNNNRVLEIPAGGGQLISLGSGLHAPAGVAVDRLGNVYIADYLNNRVVEVPAGGGAQTTVGSGLNVPQGVAVDGLGDVFIADSGNNQVVEVKASGVQTTLPFSGLNDPIGVAVDAAGDVFVTNYWITNVMELTPSGVQTILPVSGLGGNALGVGVDQSGDIFIADFNNNRVVEETRSQPPALDFGSLDVGARSADVGFSIQNIGNQTLTGTIGSPTTADFAEDLVNSTCTSGSGISLSPGASCLENFYAQPTAAGAIGATAPIVDNSLNVTSGAQSVGLSVTGLVPATETLTVTPVGSGTGTVTDDSTALNCSGSNGSVTGACSVSYQTGTAIVLTVSTPSGSRFMGWGGACASAGTAPSCNLTMSGPLNVSAIFDQQDFGSVNVCQPVQSTPAPCNLALPVTFNIPANTTIGVIQVVTQGVTGLDFSLGSGGSCTGTFTAAGTCNVNVAFTPLAPGLRMGAVELYDATGNLIASAPVYGVGHAPAIAFGPGTQALVNTTASYPLSVPNGVAVDAAGDLYIADAGNHRVVKVAFNGAVSTVGSGLNYPQGLAVDGAGDLFVADNNLNQVVEVTPAGVQTAMDFGLSAQLGVAVDGAGDVFVSSFNTNQVVKAPAGCTTGACTTVVYTAPAGLHPVGLAVDAAGDVFIATLSYPPGASPGQVVEVPAGCTGGSCQIQVGSGWSAPEAVAVDAAGDVFVADEASRIVEVPNGCTSGLCQVTVSGIYAYGIAVDAKGDVIIPDRGSDANSNQVVVLSRSLPPSLTFALTNVGSTSSDSPQTVTVQNVGNQPLTGTATYNNGTSFSVNTSCGPSFSLLPGATCSANFGFSPQSTGLQTGSAVFSDNTMNLSSSVSLQTINLIGSGGLNGQPVGVQVPNVVGLAQAAASTAISGTGLTTGTVSNASSGVVPSGSVIASNPPAGTVVNPGSAVRLLVSTGVAPPTEPNPLLLMNNFFVTGDYAAGGVTLSGSGAGNVATGTITIPDSTTTPTAQGVPDGADIIDGLLYWTTFETSASPSGNTGTFAGYPITGQQIGSDIPYTDNSGLTSIAGTLRVYRADVNAYFPVEQNGSGVRTGSGAFTVSFLNSGGTLTEGASLVVLYRVLSPNFPLKSVVIYDGAAMPATSTSQNMQGFYDALGGENGEVTTLSFAGGVWNNSSATVPLPAHASQYSAPLDAGAAYAAVILSTPVSNSDNDGILDAWKAGPADTDFYSGEPGYYDVKTGDWVPLPGASRGQKDLFVQLDYMCGAVLSDGSCDPAQENLFPSPDATGNDPLAIVTKAFADDGITLHLKIGNAVPESICTDSVSTNPPQLCQFPGEKGVIGWKNSLEFSKVWPKNLASCAAGGDCSPRFAYGQKDSYHYVLFGHSLAIPAWNTRFQNLKAISVAGGVTTITTTDRGPDVSTNPYYCPSRITISGVLGYPSLNGVYSIDPSTACSDSQHITVPTPALTGTWSYPNTTMPEPEIGLTLGNVTSISGYSDLGGSDSAVTLGLWETAPNQPQGKRANVIAGTLYHELGHTLGLTHGGLYYDNLPSYVPTFEENCKPNFQSSMNYLFQLDGVGPNSAVAFSNQTLETLTSSSQVSSLTDGSGNAATFSTSSWYSPTLPSGSTESPATRHCDGTPLNGDTGYRVNGSVTNPGSTTPLWPAGSNFAFDGVPPNNAIPFDPNPYTTLRGYNDVANIDLRQVGATGGEFASLASALSFGASESPLNIAPGGSVSVGPGGTIALGSGGTITLGSGGNITMGSGGTIALGSGGSVTLNQGGNVTMGSGGTIALGSGGTIALGSGGNVTLGSGGTITLGSGGTITMGSGGNVTLGSGGTIALGSGGTVTIPSTGGSYSVPAGGTITLGSGGNVTLGSGGNITMGSGGTIALGSGGTITLGSGGNITLGSGGTITMGSGGNVTLGSGGNITLGSGGTITMGSGGTITMGSGGNVTLGSGGNVTLGSGGNLTLGGGGNVTLGSGGTVTMGSGGTITLGSGGSATLGGGGNVTMGSGGTITMGSGGNVTLGSGGDVTIGNSGGTITLGSGGTITLGSGGNVTLGSGGTLSIGGVTTSVGPGPISVPAGGTITMGSGGTIAMGSGGNVTLGSGGTIALGSGGNITLGSGGNVTMGSGGTITMGSGGTITMGSGGTVTLGSGGNVTMGSGGTIALGSGGATLGSGGTIALGSGGTIALGSGGTVAMGSGGNITMGSGGASTTELDYNTANSVVRPPASPTYSVDSGGIQVNWMPPSFGVVQTYTISRSVDGGPPVVIGSVSGVNGNAPATTFTDTNPPTGTLVYTISTTVAPDTTDPAPRESAPSPPAVLTVDQTIVLGPFPSSVVLGSSQPTVVTATAESNNTANMQLVSFSTSGPCSAGSSSIDAGGVSSATVTLNGTGSCTITASQAGDSTTAAGGTTAYNAASSVSGTFAILPPGSPTQSQTIAFGSLPNVQYGSGFSVTATSSSGQPVSFSAPAGGPCSVSNSTGMASGTTTGVGLCTITATTAAGNNYSAASVSESFNVLPAPLNVKANNAMSIYGQALPSFMYSFSGFVNGDSASAVSGTPALSTAATAASSAGSYPIAVSTGSLAAKNYSFLYANGALTIKPAPLTITAGNGSMIYGGTVPAIAPLFAGFTNGDTYASLSVQPSCGSAVTSLSPVGSYPTSCSGAVDPNYSFTYAPGILVIEPAPTSTTAVSSTGGSSNYGQLVTITPTVSATPVPPGSDAVIYSYTNSNINGGAPVSLGSLPLSQGFSTFLLPPGVNTITAAFDGDRSDPNFASSSASVTQVVTPAPVAFISPGSVNFPATDAGSTSASATVVLTNIGTAPLNLTGVQVTSTVPGPPEFVIQSSTCGRVLDPGPPPQGPSAVTRGGAAAADARKSATVGVDNSCSVTLAFAPRPAPGQAVRIGRLVFFDNDGGHPGATQYIALTGSVSSSNHGRSAEQRTDDGPAYSPVSVSPDPLVFMPVNAGQSSTPMTVTIANNNAKLPVTLSGIALAGGNPEDFVITATTCTNGSGAASLSANAVGLLTLAPAGSAAASCTLTIVFKPGALGTRVSSLVFTYAAPAGRSDDDTPRSQQVDLNGTGAGGANPLVAVSAGNLDFRNQEQGTTSATRTVVLVNAGGGALSIDSIVPGGAFSETNTCPAAPAALPAWSSCAISVSFQPPANAKGAQAGAITITDNNNKVAGSTQVVSLTGRASP